MSSSLVRTKRLVSQKVAGYLIELSNYALFPLKNKVHASESAKNKFVIFCHGRSGSTLLLNLLNSHPDINCDGEILSRKVFSPSLLIKCRSLISPKEVYGFKLLSYQLRDVQKIDDPKGFLRNLNSKGYKIIFLRRSNMLRLVLSVMYAEFRNEWHHLQSEGRVEHKKKMIVDVTEMLKRLRESDETYSFESELMNGLPHIPISYEHDLENSKTHAATIKKIADFLGVPHSLPSDPSIVKITPKSLEGFIDNVDEIRQSLMGTKFEKYLED